MATYAIGDVHGCFATFKRLTARVQLDRRQDQVWFVGDLVNRGPASLAMLRWAVDHEDRIVVVLGNHDLHLLACAAGVAETRKRDTLEEVLDASDRDDLLAWLAARPLIHRDGDAVLVHAGLFPEWSVAEAEELAAETSQRLTGDKARKLLAAYGEKRAERWRDDLEGSERARVALAALTRIRTVTAGGKLCHEFSGPPEEAPEGCVPWFEIPERKSAGATVLFGHWAALDVRIGDGFAALDSGCAWGRSLSALRLDDGRLFQEPALEG
jgi:bis(5'-nucleosyl)-tetraphosphatase (symmetrical)